MNRFCLAIALWMAATGPGSEAPGAEKNVSPIDGDKSSADEVAIQPEPHWSLRPMVKPGLPTVQDGAWTRTPIDRFILATLEGKGLKPSPEADKRTLLRRVYFDLIGLPPTPEEMNTFMADKSRLAYEKVVDRLLASPRYGERWARHWLDVVHYAETHGHDQDRVRTNAWPYRDYVINSFNADKSYAHFVQEQIAGDVLFPNEPQAIVAMGFLATGPWDESSLRDIREDTIDRQVARYLDRDDIVTTVMNTFVSTTVQCARCHNHKFDPIRQEEYYGLQAVFAATDKANRFYDPDSKVHAKRQSLLKRQKDIEKGAPWVARSLLDTSFQHEIAIWESNLTNRPIVWVPLETSSFTSSNDATLSRQPDGSILASGKRPETDTYTITAKPGLPHLSGVRLEVLTDDSLPHKGPGRQDNGNLHLSEFRVFVADQDAGAAPVRDSSSAGTTSKSLQLQNSRADFNQSGWGIERAIDNDLKTAWGIFPEVGKPHEAIFEIKDGRVLMESATLTFVLEQNHGGGHLIGRFRLSMCTNEPPLSIDLLPQNVAKILSIPAAERTKDEQAELGLYYLRREIEQELARLPKPELVFAGASDFIPDGSFKPAHAPRPVHVLKRGDINKPGELAVPCALSCVPGLAPRFALRDLNDEGARRAALAQWITDPRNTLTWRSIVNRVWQNHFGRGIVESPNDFGKMGGRPSHPELLDWLALTFLDSGGSFKSLHRLIVTSAVYRQSSVIRQEGEAIHSSEPPVVTQDSAKGAVGRASHPDPSSLITDSCLTDYSREDADNRYLWRMNRTRLDAESVRDAVLQISGHLDLAMGGPPVMQFAISPGIHVTPVVDYAKFDVDSPASRRRSIYRFIFRTLPDPFMDTLDCADASQLTATRNVSITALQALAMLNDHFIVRYSEHFAERLSGLAPELDAQIVAACQWAFNRVPHPEEAKELAAYARKHGMANLCRLIFNSNEFMFVD